MVDAEVLLTYSVTYCEKKKLRSESFESFISTYDGIAMLMVEASFSICLIEHRSVLGVSPLG